jgi:DNA repair ATPase RecN
MKRDDIKKILGENATEEQISNLLNAFHEKESETKKQADDTKKEIDDLKKQLNKYSDYDTIKKQLDDINKANMTEQEKLEEQKKEIAENLRQSRIIVNTAKAKEILAGENVDEELLNRIVTDDVDTTVALANKFKDTLSLLKTNVVLVKSLPPAITTFIFSSPYKNLVHKAI